jgi:hypothetical protein
MVDPQAQTRKLAQLQFEAAMRAIQRRGKLERVNRAILELNAHSASGRAVPDDSDTLTLLRQMQAELAADMEAEGQQP